MTDGDWMTEVTVEEGLEEDNQRGVTNDECHTGNDSRKKTYGE